LNIFF